MESILKNARLLSNALEATGWFTCVSNIHRKKGELTFTGIKSAVTGSGDDSSAAYNAGLPVVAFRFSDAFKKEFPDIKQSSLSVLLRSKEYIIPSKFLQILRTYPITCKMLTTIFRLPTST